ncbi:Protein C27A7.1 a [Aphelenchoides avenae]|nr:Protein C27A7.1 a [Aphelenchus avenae]
MRHSHANIALSTVRQRLNGGTTRLAHMKRQDVINGAELEPMLRDNDRLSGVHGTIDMDEKASTEKNSSPSLKQYVSGRFKWLYFLLGFLILVGLAILVVALILLTTMKKIDKKYSTETASASEKFMRMYEDAMKARTTHRHLSSDIVNQLTPEQTRVAMSFGLLPAPAQQPPPARIDPPPPPGVPPISPVAGPPISPQGTAEGVQKDAERKEEAEQARAGFYQHVWHDSKCQIQCKRDDITIPPLLVISLDGFAAQYLNRSLVPSLESMAECGARAKFVYPSFPSKTFPNHYTMATGLYPEAHGIVDNDVYDPSISPRIVDVRKGPKHAAYFGGEPIWSAAVRQSRRMYCLFWPGCSVNVTGHNPTVDVPYNSSLPFSTRIDMIVEWLMLKPEQRPSLVMAYFDQPDSIGHWHTTDKQVNIELSYVESVLNYMFISLYKHGLLDCTNIVIVSDHGMQFLNKRLYVDNKVDIAGMQIAHGPVGRIHLANSTKSVDFVMDKYQCFDKQQLRLYDRQRIPKRYHFSSTPRVGDVILDGRPGTIFFAKAKDDYAVTSDHGYDYLDESMHAIFFARGPNIKPKTRLEPFQNIEYFNLFVDLLRLNHDVPNNGTLGMMNPVIHNMNVNQPNTGLNFHPVRECGPAVLFQKREVKPCVDMSFCKAAAERINRVLDECHIQAPPAGAFYTDTVDACLINLCSVTLVSNMSPSSQFAPTVVYETATNVDTSRVDDTASKCVLMDARYDSDCTNVTAEFGKHLPASVQWETILYNRENELRDLNRLQFELYKDFINGPLAYLQNLTREYVQRYTRIVSITGTVYDLDMNGIADDANVYWHRVNTSSVLQRLPTHIFRILVRCDDGLWHINGLMCREAKATRILAFLLPNQPKDYNCLSPPEYLLLNTARVRDIELLTNLQFFAERTLFSERDAMLWRTNITRSLW